MREFLPGKVREPAAPVPVPRGGLTVERERKIL
jgi:hypothetical protein